MGAGLNRILRIVRKEFLQLRRDPQMLRIIFISPIFQLFIFGYAVTTDVRHVATAVLDADRTAASRELVGRFSNSGYFEIGQNLASPGEIDRLMDSGRVQMVLGIPRGFAADLAAGRTARVQIILDGSDSMTAGIVGGYAAGVVRGHSSRIMAERMERLRSRVGRLPSVESRLRVWYNPDLKSVNFMVPGVLSMILLIVTMLLTSMAIVKEREIGTLEQLVVTPITSIELVAGKVLPYILIGFIDMVLILLVAVLWFKVSVSGSVALLFALAGVFLLTSLGLGLFISTVSRTQQQAMMTTFFFMLPSILLSGFMFPIENMPRVIQWVTCAIPLRYFLVVVRGIFLKGNGIGILWPQVAALAGLGLLILAASVWRFRKTLG
jgi:ABC-2 type transport system permease protein